MNRYIYPLGHRFLPRHTGEKIKNLQLLKLKGFPIPATYALPWDLQRVYFRHGEKFPDAFLKELDHVIDPEKSYAVRSSSSVEDTGAKTYAGQFLSILDVRGLDNILDSIRKVWVSADLEGPNTYQTQQDTSPETIQMAVAIQEMIPAQLSGVAFSRNPITGMDEIVVEAVQGSGIALVQEGVSPQRWIWKWGKWIHSPENTDISQDLIQSITLEVKRISEIFDYPVDVEWVFDGQQVFWLQARQITALQSIDIYANHIPKEFLPGVIKPLIWTVNVPLVNGEWVRLLTELIGKNQLDPLRLARSFYGYAYFNMGLLGSVFNKLGLPENALERLMGFEADAALGPSFRPSMKALKYVPRMIKFAVEKIWFHWKFEHFFEQAQKDYSDLASRDLKELSDIDVEDYINQVYLLNQRTAYFNIIVPLLMLFYHQLIRRPLDQQGIDYERINWLEGWGDRDQYDPSLHLRNLGVIFNNLSVFERQAVLNSGEAELSEGMEEFQVQFQEFLEKFGHFSDSGNDFSVRPWKETPELILELIAEYTNNPDSDSTAKPESNQPDIREGYLYRQSLRYSRYREQISYLYTRGFSLFRSAYLRIGTSFCQSGWLEDPEDIFFLEHNEIFSVVQQKLSGISLGKLVEKRKKDHSRNLSISLPSIIYGEHLPPIQDPHTSLMVGIPASRGKYRGVVRVVNGLGDFQKISDECVLVIPFSDVSWTPLFARAGAVIAEAGGLLSHSAIVAREYGIPAIVSVPNATRLQDDIEVTVDGYSGIVIVHDPDLEEADDVE